MNLKRLEVDVECMIRISRLFKSFTTKCVRREMQIDCCNLTLHTHTQPTETANDDF